MALPTGKTRLALLKEGLYSGIGWAVGVTVGFALVSTVIVVLLNQLGGLPIIGGFVANIVDTITAQVSTRGVYNPSRKVSPTPTSFQYPIDTQ